MQHKNQRQYVHVDIHADSYAAPVDRQTPSRNINTTKKKNTRMIVVVVVVVATRHTYNNGDGFECIRQFARVLELENLCAYACVIVYTLYIHEHNTDNVQGIRFLVRRLIG